MNEHKTTTDRLGAFSDAVIAVIITIMVLELEALEEATAAVPVATYAALFVCVNIAYLVFERLALRQADEAPGARL